MKNYTRKTLKTYYQHILHYKIAVTFILTSVIGASLVNAIVPLYFKKLFNTLAASSPQDNIIKSLVYILIIIAGLEFLQWIFWRVATFTNSYFQPKVMADLANYCFAYLHKHSFSYFNNNFVGSLVKRVKWFVRAFEVVADKITWNLLPLIVNISAITFILFYVNVLLGVSVMIWTILFLLINWGFTKYKLKYDIARSKSEPETTRVLADTITNHTNVKLFNGYQRALNEFARVIEKFRQLQRLTWDLGNAIEAVQGFLMIGLEIGLFYLAIKLWQKVLLQAYLINIFHRVWDFGKVIRAIYENLADAEEMTIILNTPHEIQDIAGAKKLIVTNKKIEFKDVTFSYPKNQPVLENFNLTIGPGERLALIGPSGAGKSTIIKLLLRIHDIDKGKILIDGQDISKITQESLWENVSLVPQDPILFHQTLMENIRYGKPKATDKEVILAAKSAHCNEFIGGLFEGYDTYVGERGIKLSGGERQRVAIARAILRSTPILILDEATSSLDSESESFIQDALDKLMKGKTVIVIAHRLSTIRKMDRIIVVDDTGIIEEGTHQQLHKLKKGIYKKLWELQAGGFTK